MKSSIATPQRPVEDIGLAEHKDNVDQLSEISRNSQATFLALILVCVYSYLAIATTTDAALISNSNATPLPIIQVNVPIVWFYYFAPIMLAVLYAYFHLYLERYWRCLARLPLRHPDGRGLDDYIYPWLIASTFIRGGIPELSTQRVSARLEAWLSLLLAWWLVPIVLLFYWARYLVAHDWVGTLLHLLLIVMTVGLALRFYFTARNALRGMSRHSDGDGDDEQKLSAPVFRLSVRQWCMTAAGVMFLITGVVYLSMAALHGLSPATCEKLAGEESCRLYGVGQRVWEVIAIAPRTEITEHRFIAKPENWDTLIGQADRIANFLDAQRTLVLDRRDLRNMNAKSAFLPGSRIRRSDLAYADLRHAVLTGARLEDLNLRGVNLEDADLQHAQIVNVQFDGVIANAARLSHARFDGATTDLGTRLSGSFSDAHFERAAGERLHFDGNGQSETSFRDAHLAGATFDWAQVERVDFSFADMTGTSMANSQFQDTDFSQALIKRARFDFSTFMRCRFISSNISDSYFMYARLVASQFAKEPAPRSLPALEPSTPKPLRWQIDRFQGFNVELRGKTTVRDIHFEEADLRYAIFDNVELQNVEFAKTDLSYATFTNVDLSAVDFLGVDLSDANLRGARNVSARLLDGACGNAQTKLPRGSKIRPCTKR
jgi:uncharacterized protein YjbI with pentapeptide repeats